MSVIPHENKQRGFGLPADHIEGWPIKPKYGHALDNRVTSRGVAVREQRMLEFMSQVTDKPD